MDENIRSIRDVLDAIKPSTNTNSDNRPSEVIMEDLEQINSTTMAQLDMEKDLQECLGKYHGLNRRCWNIVYK